MYGLLWHSFSIQRLKTVPLTLLKSITGQQALAATKLEQGTSFPLTVPTALWFFVQVNRELTILQLGTSSFWLASRLG
jgi:hypothetical protein